MRMLAATAAAIALVTPSSFLQAQQHADGGWGDPQLTAWSALGLRAAGADTGGALDYLVAHEAELTQPTGIALVALAEAALGHDPQTLLARLPTAPGSVNAAVWEILALRQSGRAAPPALSAYVVRAQAKNGGFPWTRGVAPDSNDTAAAIEALRAAGVRGHVIAHALGYLRTLQAPDGGFRLSSGRAPDAQSTALAIQAFVAAGLTPPKSAFAFLASLRRSDGSYRYSRAYTTTPVWVTAQVLPALVKQAFPLR
ncbi:MAG: hypothetical protein ACYDA3_02005 [Gaiellaceae bacterium]